MRDLISNAGGAPLLGAYVVPEEADREAAADLAGGARAAGADFVITATSGPERSRYTSTNQSIDLAAACQNRAAIPTVATVTTWSRTVMALQAHLLGGHARGVTRLVCGNGSSPPSWHQSSAEGRWAVDVVELIELLRGLNEGKDRYGLQLEVPTQFDVGVRIRALPTLAAEDRARTKRKIEAGVHFIISSPVYTPRALEPLLEVVDGAVPVLASVHQLRSLSEARRLKAELPDDSVPDDVIARLDRAGEQADEEGVRIAVELASTLSEMAQGVILSRADRPDVVAQMRAELDRRAVS